MSSELFACNVEQFLEHPECVRHGEWSILLCGATDSSKHTRVHPGRDSQRCAVRLAVCLRRLDESAPEARSPGSIPAHEVARIQSDAVLGSSRLLRDRMLGLDAFRRLLQWTVPLVTSGGFREHSLDVRVRLCVNHFVPLLGVFTECRMEFGVEQTTFCCVFRQELICDME